MFKDEELLNMAVEFDIGPQPISAGVVEWWLKYPAEADRNHVYVRRTGKTSWAITNDSHNCLNRDGEWEYSPLPSNRDDEYLNRCRYKSREEAITYAVRWREKALELAKELLKTQRIVELHHLSGLSFELLMKEEK